MRTLLSQVLTDAAARDPKFMVLSGDHGYALFDSIRKKFPAQFLNVGVAEQLMVSLAAGLTTQGFKPVVYGLAAFVPMRVLEQIKLDVCFSKAPVIFLGDGAGLVYSTLGASHQCAEDLSALRALPYLQIFSPSDAEELRICFEEAQAYSGPSYIRIGKSDRPAVHSINSLKSTEPHWIIDTGGGACLIASGSMTSLAAQLAKQQGLSCLSVPRIKPFSARVIDQLKSAQMAIVLEEHSRYGGLASSILDGFNERGARPPLLHVLSLKEQFSELGGSYSFAMSEHELSDAQVEARVRELITFK